MRIKLLLAALLLCALISLSGCVKQSEPTSYVTFVPKPGPAYTKYNPTEFLKDWELVDSRARLGVMGSKIQEQLAAHNAVDAAMWEFRKGHETLYIWVKIFDSQNDTFAAAKDFFSMLSWKTYTKLAFGDKGAVGVYRLPNEPNPLLLYSIDNTTLLHIAYYNQDGLYNATNIYKDQRFLTQLARHMLGV